MITYPTAELVRHFTQQYPGVQIAIAEASDSQQAGEWVESGRAEVAVFELSQRTPALTRERLLSYELYAVFPEGNGTSDIDEAGDIAWEALTGRPLIAGSPRRGGHSGLVLL
ncbi:LysR family transcriptional regulator substrate-binding protein [Sinomonas flava]|uniref:LysR substrate-binding domain-containing protein n=1 Tax=Sinomonas flava TaxID=496857 RepID=A0ABP5NWV5_9MICC